MINTSANISDIMYTKQKHLNEGGYHINPRNLIIIIKQIINVYECCHKKIDLTFLSLFVKLYDNVISKYIRNV